LDRRLVGLQAPPGLDLAGDGRSESRSRADPYETELVERAQHGDLDAFDALLANHEAAAKRLALIMTLSPESAADATQEAFIRCFRAIEKFRLGEPFRPWLMSIVANEARGIRRRDWRRARLAERLGSLAQEHAVGADSMTLRNEGSAAVIAALGRLDDHHRLAITYRYFLDMSEADMARALHVAPGTIKSRLSRALVRLRSELADES
jgi:RNA polymerase sigma-70 factor, ECF subfamily